MYLFYYVYCKVLYFDSRHIWNLDFLSGFVTFLAWLLLFFHADGLMLLIGRWIKRVMDVSRILKHLHFTTADVQPWWVVVGWGIVVVYLVVESLELIFFFDAFVFVLSSSRIIKDGNSSLWLISIQSDCCYCRCVFCSLFEMWFGFWRWSWTNFDRRYLGLQEIGFDHLLYIIIIMSWHKRKSLCFRYAMRLAVLSLIPARLHFQRGCWFVLIFIIDEISLGELEVEVVAVSVLVALLAFDLRILFVLEKRCFWCQSLWIKIRVAIICYGNIDLQIDLCLWILLLLYIYLRYHQGWEYLIVVVDHVFLLHQILLWSVMFLYSLLVFDWRISLDLRLIFWRRFLLERLILQLQTLHLQTSLPCMRSFLEINNILRCFWKFKFWIIFLFHSFWIYLSWVLDVSVVGEGEVLLLGVLCWK